MTTSDSFMSDLAGMFLDHGDALAHIQDAGYNPEERRRRYLLERQLKGRRPGKGRAAPVRRTAKARTTSAGKGGRPVKKSGANLSKAGASRANAKARVAAIEGRLGSLQKVLSSLLAQKAGKGKTAAKTKSKADGPAEKQTAQQKSKQAEASKDHYEKNKTEILKKAKAKAEKEGPKLSDAAIDAKIKNVRSQISKAQSELKSARAKLSK